jgi:N12 class adenine-specific DNA methylase
LDNRIFLKGARFMATSTLPWLDLSAYKLMAQLSVDKTGNQALLIRPANLDENPETSKKRAQVLQNRFQGVSDKVGAKTFRARVLRGQINVLTGRMIANPASMHQFLTKMFSQGQEIQVTLDQMQQLEAIREAAQQFKADDAVEDGSLINFKALNEAAPGGVSFDVRENYFIAYQEGQTPEWHAVSQNATNYDVKNWVKEAIDRYSASNKTDHLATIIQRLDTLNKSLDRQNIPYWLNIIGNQEIETLNRWVEEIRGDIEFLTNATAETPEGQKELRDAIISRLDTLDSVSEPNLVKRLADIEADLAGETAGGPKTELDNVQENQAGTSPRTGTSGAGEQAGAGPDTGLDNVQGRGGSIGTNLDGDVLFEDANGVRSIDRLGVRVEESVGLVPSRAGGYSAQVDVYGRPLTYRTVDEALDAPDHMLSLGRKMRAGFEQQGITPPGWAAVTLTHQGEKVGALVRSAGKTAGNLQVMRLTVGSLLNGQPQTINAWIQRLSPSNELTDSGLPGIATKDTLNNWTNFGLPLPKTQTTDVELGENADTVKEDEDTEAQTNDRDRNGQDERRTDQPDSGGAGDAGGGDAGAQNTGGNGNPGISVGDGSGRSGGSVPDPVGYRDESGSTDAGGQRTPVSDTQSGVEAAENQQGSGVHAGEDAAGTGSGRAGVGNGPRGTGSDESAGNGQSGTDSEQSAGNAAGGTGTGRVPGSADERVSQEVADEPTVSGSGERNRTSASENNDGNGSGPGRSGAGEPGAVDYSADPNGGGDQSSATDARGRVEDGSPEKSGIGGQGTAGGSESGDRVGSGGGSGSDDWERFAQQHAADSTAENQPFVGRTEFEKRGASQRLKDNLSAMYRLFQLEGDSSTPTAEDREELAKFSGFGGIHSKMFAPYAGPEWVSSGNDAVREMTRNQSLNTQEFESLRSTILNAHYTHSGIIEPMWEALDRMGVPMDRVLEPSAGTLNFKSFMPESVRQRVGKFTAVELDPITARIAALVHPDASVVNKGLEKTSFPDDFFDVSISNIPFGDYKVFDPEHPLRKTSIHNAFFLKGLDKVRPGGVIAFVTSAYVLDSADQKVREEIMERSHVAGVYRLPTGTFKDTTGTEVVTDLIFLQKKGNFEPNYQSLDILQTQTVNARYMGGRQVVFNGEMYDPGDEVPGMKMNRVYVDHPERLLGELEVTTGQFGPELRVTGNASVDEQKETIRAALASLPSNIPVDKAPEIDPRSLQEMNASEEETPVGKLPGALSIQNGKIYVATIQKDGQVKNELAPMPKTKSLVNRALAATEVMLSMSDLLESESNGNTTDSELYEKRQQLQAFMDGWEKLEKGKTPLPRKIEALLKGDPRARKVNILDMVTETGEIERPDIVYSRTVQPVTEAPAEAETLEHALAISLAYTAEISENYIANLLSNQDQPMTRDEVRSALVEKNLAFIDPKTDKLIESSVYLSGNLKPKMNICKNIVESDERFQKNLDALEAALPEPLKPSQIKVSLDGFWLPEDIMNKFLEEGLGLRVVGSLGIQAKFDDFQRHWRLEASSLGGKPSLARIADEQHHVTMNRFGTGRKNALELLHHAYTNTIPKVMDKIPGTEPPKYQINAQETLKAQGKYDEIVDAFDRWVFKDPKRAQRLTDIYNEQHNTTVLYDPDGSHMVFPGMSDKFVPRKHQMDFAWRAVSGRNCMSAHCVGAGKTLELIASAVRGKQMGRWSKPMVVVPNHMLDQFANDANDIYPNAKVLVMTAADGRAVNRPAFAAKCAMGNWDLVVCTHSVFEKITVPQHFEAQIVDRELAKLRATLENQEKQRRPKEVEKAIKRLEAQLEKTLDDINKSSENILNMGEIGVDFIGIDEAHYFKNLMVDTSSQIPGVSNASSKRAMSMLIRCQYLRELHGGPYGVMMATGTPISNSVTELYTFNRMLRPDLLEEAGILNFNDWMGLYGQVKHGMEIKPEGGGYQMKSRLSRFKNIPEMVKMARSFIDFKTREDLNLPTPDVDHQQIVAPQGEFMKGFMKYIEARARTVRNKNSEGEPESAAEFIATSIREALYQANDKTLIDQDTGEIDPDMVDMPNMDILLTIATDGRKASLDPRLIHPKFPDEPTSKVNKAVDRLMHRYHQYDEQKAAQMVFCDFSSPTGKGIFNVYDDMKRKLIAKGVPESEIGFIHHAKTDADKEDLFARVRSGECRFLFGSTMKMGVGTNVQERLVGMIQLDPPWKPADVEQRLGRMERQGNMFEDAHNDTMTTEDSFDLFMWETLNRKLKMISQAMRNPEDCAREINEETEPGYEDILAVTTGNPAIREFMDARVQLDRLKRMQDSHTDQQADLGTKIDGQKEKIKRVEAYLRTKLEEKALVEANTPLALTLDGPVPGLCQGPMAVTGGIANLGAAIKELTDQAKAFRTTTLGTFGGMTVKASRMSSDPTLIVERMDGRDDQLFKIATNQDDLIDPENPNSEYEDAAKALVKYVRRIGRDNGISETEDAVRSAKDNLKRLEEDLGRPFAYAEEIQEVRATYKRLSEELGDEIDDKKHLDPEPLAAFAEAIHAATGEHGDLAQKARSIVEAENRGVLSEMLADERNTTLISITGDDDDDLDDDLEHSVA